MLTFKNGSERLIGYTFHVGYSYCADIIAYTNPYGHHL